MKNCGTLPSPLLLSSEAHKLRPETTRNNKKWNRRPSESVRAANFPLSGALASAVCVCMRNCRSMIILVVLSRIIDINAFRHRSDMAPTRCSPVIAVLHFNKSAHQRSGGGEAEGSRLDVAIFGPARAQHRRCRECLSSTLGARNPLTFPTPAALARHVAAR
jgi:hypothetical protein